MPGVRAARRGVLAVLLGLSVLSPAMAQPLTKVEVLLDWKALPTYAGFFLAKDIVAFERLGLDVTFVEVQGATPSA